MTTKQPQALTEAFWARVDKRGPNECWPWIGTIGQYGYGLVQHGHTNWRAHRLSYTINTGPIPDGLVVMHACDNRACINPAHLSLGTVADNNADMRAKGRIRNAHFGQTHCKHGHPLAGGNVSRYTRKDGRERRVCLTCEKTRRLRSTSNRPTSRADRRARAALSTPSDGGSDG